MLTSQEIQTLGALLGKDIPRLYCPRANIWEDSLESEFYEIALAKGHFVTVYSDGFPEQGILRIKESGGVSADDIGGDIWVWTKCVKSIDILDNGVGGAALVVHDLASPAFSLFVDFNYIRFYRGAPNCVSKLPRVQRIGKGA